MKNSNSRCQEEILIDIPDAAEPRLVIIGGGFAGLYLAKHLRKSNFQIVMLDKNNFHAFQPLFYQVATAMLEPEAVASSFRKILNLQHNFHYRMVKIERINPADKIITTDAGCVSYDILVIATGTRTNFYGMEDIAHHAFPMKNVSEAIDIRHRIFNNFETAMLTKDQEERESLMNIVIVGGGPTGIEIAGAIGELKKFILPHDYRDLDLQKMHVYLVEATDRLLNGMSLKASRLAQKGLEKFSVTLLLNTKITAYDGKTVVISDGRKLSSRMLIWVAGVEGNIPEGLDKAKIVSGNRLMVDNFNRVPEYKNIYAIGDVAAVITEKTPHGHPMVAPVAIQQAANLAKNLSQLSRQKKNKPKPFTYKDKGIMVSIGRNRAIVETPWFTFDGLPAWITWLFVHLMSLVGFRNKIIAFINWGWNYLSRDRGMRLILSRREDKGRLQ